MSQWVENVIGVIGVSLIKAVPLRGQFVFGGGLWEVGGVVEVFEVVVLFFLFIWIFFLNFFERLVLLTYLCGIFDFIALFIGNKLFGLALDVLLLLLISSRFSQTCFKRIVTFVHRIEELDQDFRVVVEFHGRRDGFLGWGQKYFGVIEAGISSLIWILGLGQRIGIHRVVNKDEVFWAGGFSKDGHSSLNSYTKK